MSDERPPGDPYRAGNGYRPLPADLDPRGRPTRGATRRASSSRRDVVSGLALGGRIVAALLSLAIIVTAGVVWARYRQFQGNISRVSAIEPSKSPKKDIDGKDQNILIVGNDDRETATDAELREIGTTRDGGSLNTDTMMLLHVPANGKKAAGISFPRDSYVSIPGFGMGKLNSAYPDGYGAATGSVEVKRSAGAKLLVQTLQDLTGLTVDHYVQVDLLGFYRISNAIGGITVCLNHAQGPATYVGQTGPGYDSGYEPNGTWVPSYSGINLKAGINTDVKGLQALAFVRQRHGLDRGDLDRIVRQQYFLSAVFRKVTSAGTLLNPIKLNNLLNAVSSSLQMDGDAPGHTGLDPLKLAQQMQGLAAGNLTFTQIPTTGDTIDGSSVQVIDTAGMKARINALIGTPAAPSAYASAKIVSPSTVTVSVLNGSGGSGVARTNADALTQAGFKTTFGDGSSSAATQILYPAGQESGAKTLAQYVPGATVSVSTTVTTVTLLIGTDGKKAYPTVTTSPTTTAPTTTAAPTSAGATGDTRTAADTSCIN